MRKHITLCEGLGTHTFPVEWKTSIDDAYRQNGRNLKPVTRRMERLCFGPFVLGGYEVDEGYEDKKLKGFVITQAGGNYRETFLNEETARQKLEDHMAKIFDGF